MATPNIVPRADSEGGLGTASKYWASAYIDLIYVGAGKVGRDADNLIDFSSDNQFTFRIGGNNEIIIDGSQIYPATNDGMALGYAGNGWSNLFLASGAVINFDNGNVTLTHTNNKLIFGDSDQLGIGNDADLVMYHDTQDSYITNDTGDLEIKNNANDKDIIFKCDDGSGGTTAYLTLDGSQGFTTLQKAIRAEDNVHIQAGTSGDLRIYHNGSNSVVQNVTGNLTIENTVDDGDIIFQSDDGSGGVAEYFRLDGGIKRTIFTENIGLEDNTQLLMGSGNDLQLYHDGTDSFVKNSHGNLVLRNVKQNKDVLFQGDDGQASDDTIATYFYLDGSSATHDGSATTALYTNWPDKSRISLGTSHDLMIYHDGSNSYVENEVGNLTIFNKQDDGDIIFASDNGSGGTETYFFLDGSHSSGNPYTHFPDNSHLVFGGSTDDLDIYHDGTNSYIQNTTGNLIINQRTDDGDIAFQCDDGSGGVATYLTLDGGLGYTRAYKDIRFEDNKKALFGTGSDLRIYHDGSNAFFDNIQGDVYYRQYYDGGDVYFQCDDGSGGLANYFSLDGSNVRTSVHKDFRADDNVKIQAGTSGDLDIYHTGSNATIDNATGDFIIQNSADDKDIIFKSDDGSGGLETYFFLDGSANSGNLPITVFPDNSKLTFGTDYDLQILHDGSNSKILANGTGSLIITQGTVDQDIIFKCDDGSGGETAYLTLDGSAGHTVVNKKCLLSDNVQLSVGSSDHGVSIIHDGSASTITNAIGDLTITNFQNDGDIIFKSDDGSGGTAEYFRIDGEYEVNRFLKNARFNDGVKANFGTVDDLQIYHDGSNSYIDEAGTGNLYVRGDAQIILSAPSGGEVYAKFIKDGACEFRHNDSTKLATTSAGVDVTGDVSITSTAASAVGAGFDGAETVAIQVGEVNQEIITTIQIDLGTGGATDIVSSGTAGDVIGENDTAAAFITKYDSTKNGVLYKAELICLETPVGGDTDINLVLNATSLAEDAAGEAEGHVIIDGGAQTIGMRTESTASVVTAAAGAHNDYIYLTHGGTTAGTYSAGKFLIRLYGAKATL